MRCLRRALLRPARQFLPVQVDPFCQWVLNLENPSTFTLFRKSLQSYEIGGVLVKASELVLPLPIPRL